MVNDIFKKLNPASFKLNEAAHTVTAIQYPGRCSIASVTLRGNRLATVGTSLDLDAVAEQLESSGFAVIRHGGIAIAKRK